MGEPEGWGRPAPPPRPILIRQDMLAEGEPGRRIDFEKGMSYTPWVSILLILVNTAIFAYLVASGSLADRDALIEAGPWPATASSKARCGAWLARCFCTAARHT